MSDCMTAIDSTVNEGVGSIPFRFIFWSWIKWFTVIISLCLHECQVSYIVCLFSTKISAELYIIIIFEKWSFNFVTRVRNGFLSSTRCEWCDWQEVQEVTFNLFNQRILLELRSPSDDISDSWQESNIIYFKIVWSIPRVLLQFF